MHEELISVIIPVYNTAEYLPRCLESVLNNTYRNLEVICINDGSKDNSIEVLNAYAQKDSRIRVIDQENAGVSAARNRGLDEATGEYIAFVDSDDWIHRQYFETLHGFATKTNSVIVECDAQYVSEEQPDQEIEPADVPFLLQTAEQMLSGEIPVWGKLYHVQLLDTIRFTPNVHLGEDILFNLEVLYSLEHACLCRCKQALYFYFAREGSAVRTEQPKKLEPLLRWWLSNLHLAPSDAMRAISLEKAVKRLFYWRYCAMFSNDKQEQAVLKELVNLGKRELRQIPLFPSHKKATLLAMAQFPFLYRLFRIITDPTMLGWERLQRKKARAEKNQS